MSKSSNKNASKQSSKRKQKKSVGALAPTDTANFRSPTAVVFPRSIFGLPDKLVTTLKYSQMINFTGSASPTAQVFAVNSAFDPDFSGTGHQPSYYDKIAAVYARYFVESFDLDVTISNESATVPINYAICYSTKILEQILLKSCQRLSILCMV